MNCVFNTNKKKFIYSRSVLEQFYHLCWSALFYHDLALFICSNAISYTGSEQNEPWGTPLAQLVECQTLDRKVTGSNLTRGAVLCL